MTEADRLAISSERRTEIMKRLQQQVKTNVGISIALRLADHMTLERSAGKACHVIDRRKRANLQQPGIRAVFVQVYQKGRFWEGAVGFSPRNRSVIQVPFRAGLPFRSQTAQG